MLAERMAPHKAAARKSNTMATKAQPAISSMGEGNWAAHVHQEKLSFLNC